MREHDYSMLRQSLCQSANDTHTQLSNHNNNYNGLAEVGVIIGGEQPKDEVDKKVDTYSSQFESSKQSIIDIAMEGDEVAIIGSTEVKECA